MEGLPVHCFSYLCDQITILFFLSFYYFIVDLWLSGFFSHVVPILYEDLDQTDLFGLQCVNFHHISDKTPENIITSDILR